jgi:glycerol-3-phosphate cytidylyltransferase-like family protein
MYNTQHDESYEDDIKEKNVAEEMTRHEMVELIKRECPAVVIENENEEHNPFIMYNFQGLVERKYGYFKNGRDDKEYVMKVCERIRLS